MALPKVLLIGPIVYANEEWESLSDVADILVAESKNRVEFLKEARCGAFDGIVAAYHAGISKFMGRFDEEILASMPKSLKFICHSGAGYDSIDVTACSVRHIQVSNIPDSANEATADTTMFLILGALRGFNAHMTTLREGIFMGPSPAFGHDPKGKTLGILGMGSIGRNVAKKALAFGMKIQYHNRKPLSSELNGDVKYVAFDELLLTSDVLSLSLPLTASTYHIISASEFAKMKRGIVIINTARGPVMDENALVKALEEGIVHSCGLDVYEKEPEVHPSLLKNPNVLLLPHVGTLTFETRKDMEIYTILNVREGVMNGRLPGLVPEQKVIFEIQK